MEVLSTTYNIILIIIGFGLLVFVHELGHFIAAKWAGIRTEAFAVGMGPVLLSWRKGLGVRFGSTNHEVVRRMGKQAAQCTDHELADAGIGETEYSLRILPLGGFVKMVGQDDLDPSATSSSKRSYNVTPVGKRMVVVSAGVIMNIILAIILFLVAFMVGVKFEAPVIGYVMPDSPASQAQAEGPNAAGVDQRGLLPGDEVVSIDGSKVNTFADMMIASAMSRPGTPLHVTVDREGVPGPLEFTILPEQDERTNLLSIGVGPSSSTTLTAEEDLRPFVELELKDNGLSEAGITPGSTIQSVDGEKVTTFGQVDALARSSDGRNLASTWSVPGKTGPVSTELPVEPTWQRLFHERTTPEQPRRFEEGLLGMTPLVKVTGVPEGSLNAGVLQAGDVILKFEHHSGPTRQRFRQLLQENPGTQVDLVVLRDGKDQAVTASIGSNGQLGIGITYAWNLPVIARPMNVLGGTLEDPDAITNSAIEPLDLFPLTRIDSVGDMKVTDWRSMRDGFTTATSKAAAEGLGATIELTYVSPTPDGDRFTVPVVLDAAQVSAIDSLGWRPGIQGELFDPLQTTLQAGGNPLKAVSMGFKETSKLVLLTYLTIDRLIRGSVGVEQIHGPLGIVHVGSRIADRGYMYLVFFIAMISVNLAVINFLPLPIVDGGLFLFLVYEKIKGRPPSVAFQNAATIAGLCFLGLVFVVTFYNDVMRMIN